MGVGAGKTFFTLTLLQYLKHKMQNNPGKLAPSFCMAPDEAVAEVTKRSINRQGIISAMSSAAITRQEQMPDSEFIALYQEIAERAAQESEHVDECLNQGLQTEILDFCRGRGLHPNNLINLIYNQGQAAGKQQVFKDSIDVKRLLLLVEGQKTIKNKTGMLGVSALSNLLE
ncbi:hypothetical protein BN59_01687 [Legionella massiliensis]|uniref:Uncharacterized protein n=2 Tax=Legionella massiliensis TaxID=1034943 RepID=A0A078L032_9GAMM|nr:hypothetical protein BN59_01687 [Legionella massiliensis]CEE13142.1 hypothetical protein BN1094_01687 [Legionella massiliensis]